MPSRRILTLLIACGLGVALAGAGLVVAAAGRGSPEVQGGIVQLVPAPERRQLPAVDGPNVRQGQPDVALAPAGGRPLVINFWASWCPPCRTEQRGLELASRRLAADGVRFVGVNVRDDRAAAAAYLDEFGVTYPSIYDREGHVTQALGAEAPQWPPWTLIVDGQGRVAARITGALPGGGQPEAQAAELVRLVREATK